MEMYLDVCDSQEAQPRRFPLVAGRTWRAGRYTHLGGPLVEGRYLRTRGPLLDKDEYIPLKADRSIKRYHFEAGRDEAGAWVRDLAGSDTRLNGVLLRWDQRYPLRPDDELRVSKCVVLVAAVAPVDPAWLAWSDGTVVKLATAIAQERAFGRLPILGDALEEAGCTDAEILGHCREPGEHFGRCWLVNLLLGKS